MLFRQVKLKEVVVLLFIISNPELHELYRTNRNREIKVWACCINTTLLTKRCSSKYGTNNEKTKVEDTNSFQYMPMLRYLSDYVYVS